MFIRDTYRDKCNVYTPPPQNSEVTPLRENTCRSVSAALIYGRSRRQVFKVYSLNRRLYDDEDAVDVADNTKRRAALGNRDVAEAENPRLLARAAKWRLNESGNCTVSTGAAREKRSLKIVFDVSPWADHLINEEKEVPPFARLCDRVSRFYGFFASQRRSASYPRESPPNLNVLHRR